MRPTIKSRSSLKIQAGKQKSFDETLMTPVLETGNCYEQFNGLESAVKKESSFEVFNFISDQLDLQRNSSSILFCTNEMSRTEGVEFDHLRAIINFKKLNLARDIDEHLRAINTLLPDGGIYIGRAETYWERRKRICRKFGSRIGQLVWIIDSIINRAFARMRVFDHIYRWITGGTFHMLSNTELLGRIFYCGFSVIDTFTHDGLQYFAVIRTKEPSIAPPPSTRLLFRMQRVGKGGELFGVYKFRTMHPYAEYVQDYIVQMNGYNEVGKPNNDWRVTSWGKWMRKLWLDELPQIINVLKREMRIVGVRPLSKYRFSEFPEEIQHLRIQNKPGCIPPYVALNMPDEKGNIEAEVIYLKDCQRYPNTVNIRYFSRAVYNILSNQIRSA